MAQMADPREPARPQYPPPDDPNQGSYYGQAQSPQRAPGRDDRSSYPPPPDPARQGQYPPPPDPRAQAPYPPPGQWPGQHAAAYPPPPPGYPHYPYPPRPDMTHPPQPMQPDAYRLPPPYPYYATPYAPAPAPAPRQRTAIACKYCRKRKIRCSGYDSSPDGRCQNCVRFNQQCLFHPVSSQAAFVPASAVYGPNARAPVAGGGPDGRENGQHYPRNGEQPMLYGAHGQPLGPPGPQGQPQYSYAPPPGPQGYPPQPYQYPHYQAGPAPYDNQGQAPPAQDDRVSLKRPPPDDDPHNENSHASQSPHPNSRPRHSTYDARANSSGSYDYPDPTNLAPTSPATSTMSYQSYPPQPRYANGGQPQKGNASPPAGLTPQSATSYHSPHTGPARDDGRTPPPNQPGSASSSNNSRSGMKVHEMLGNPNPHGAPPEQRARNDSEMLSKLDAKK